MKEKKSSVLMSFIWRFAERCGSQGVSFVISIILARLLAPEVYGRIALVTAFIAILNVFIESGMGTALVQKKEADDLDFSTLFYFNIAMCGALYTLLYLCAPIVSAFYEDLQLTSVIRVLGFTLIIYGIKAIQVAYVSRHMIFKKFFYSTIVATIVSAVIGIMMAYMGYGIWSLVAQQLSCELVSTIILWIAVPWRPKLIFSFERLRDMFSYGWKLLVSSLIESVYNEIRQLLIGKIYTSADLAYYNKGRQFPHLIVNNVNTTIKSVLLPTMAREQDNVGRVKAMTRRSICFSTYFMAPLMIGLVVCAEPLVRFLLTDAWIDSVFFLRVFAISFMLYPIHTANLNAIKAMGRSDVFLKLEIIKKIIGIILLLATLWISVEAVALSLLVSTLISSVVNNFPNRKLLDYGWIEQLKDIMPYIGLAILMGLPVFMLQYLPLPTIIVLILQVIVGAIIYIGLSALFKLEMFTYLFTVVKSFWKGKNPHD